MFFFKRKKIRAERHVLGSIPDTRESVKMLRSRGISLFQNLFRNYPSGLGLFPLCMAIIGSLTSDDVMGLSRFSATFYDTFGMGKPTNQL